MRLRIKYNSRSPGRIRSKRKARKQFRRRINLRRKLLRRQLKSIRRRRHLLRRPKLLKLRAKRANNRLPRRKITRIPNNQWVKTRKLSKLL
jgi:hypothetical protein